MSIFTSYYYKACNLNPEHYLFVQVSKSVPKDFAQDLMSMPELYPSYSLLTGYKNGSISEKKYTVIYEKQLSLLDKDYFIKKLTELSAINNKDVVLLCWEGSNKFCHRKLIARWLDCNVTEL